MSEVFMAASALPRPATTATATVSVLSVPQMVVIYANNDERGLRFAMERAAQMRFPGVRILHANPSRFAAPTAPSGVVAAYFRARDSERQVEIGKETYATLAQVIQQRSPQVELLVVTEDEAEALNQQFDQTLTEMREPDAGAAARLMAEHQATAAAQDAPAPAAAPVIPPPAASAPAGPAGRPVAAAAVPPAKPKAVK